MKINYIIATCNYNSSSKRKYLHPLPENTLKQHLKQLLYLKHNLSQITIMKAKSVNYYKNYYNIEDIIEKFDIPVKIIDCENYGYSGGQWLKAYEIYKNEFDYYVFNEDDYCFNQHYFDKIIVKCYNNYFKNNIGLLTSVIGGTQFYSIKNNKYPIHFSGLVFLSCSTLNKLYNDEKWKGSPRKYLDLMDSSIDPKYDWDGKKKDYPGAYYQLSFSNLFNLSNIKFESHLNYQYPHFIYWEDGKNKCVRFSLQGESRKKVYRRHISKSLYVPIQCIKIML